ncbi:MAG: GTP-binding protein [Candidatus Heimdallarchaeota archaeon]|nr:MAG: GTP-binding protein [Candidatus Heimdallarchaeota archaeon]
MTVLKIVLIGDGGVGKTAIRERYLGKGFKAQYLLTIGADFAMRDDTIRGDSVRYQIWDLAGQQRFDAVREVYYKGSVGALLVYDVTRPDSYFNTPKWINELWTNNGRGRVPIVVVANKIDMRELSDDTVSPEQGRVFTERLTKLTRPEGFDCYYIETSAKTGVNIQAAFTLLGENIMRFVSRQRKTSRTSTSRLRAAAQQQRSHSRRY